MLPSDFSAFNENDIRVGALLGEGYWGSVSLARIRSTGMECVVKIPKHRGKVDAELLLMAQIHHPQIVRLLGFVEGSATRGPILVMERLKCNLQQAIEAERKDRGVGQPYTFTVRTVCDCARGLAALHNRSMRADGGLHNRSRLLHGDLHLGNVLVDEGGRAKLGDLGNVKSVGQNIELTHFSCHPMFLPPEGARKEFSDKTDIYMLGLLMVQMLTKRALGSAQDRPTIIEEAMQTVGRCYPSPVGDILEACLADNPARRPTALEVVKRLEVGRAGVLNRSEWINNETERERGGGQLDNHTLKYSSSYSPKCLLIKEIEDVSTCDPKMCCICIDQHAVMASLPCGHRAYCPDCATPNIKTCSLCRKKITDFVRIYG